MATRVAHLREALPALRPITSDATYLAAKRAMDIVLALVALIVLAPLMALIALAIALDSRGPVVFRQQRVRGEQNPATSQLAANCFEFLKFRTMCANADPSVHLRYVEQLIVGAAQQTENGAKKLYKLQNDRRITRVGGFL
ncbi:MAG: sugar transferase, partial [Chloroflexota bacterium]